MSVTSIEDILHILPHRYPFLLVDRVVALEPGEHIHAYKNVSINEPFFQGHFPQKPVMPGMLIVEGIAQAAGVMCKNILPPEDQDRLTYLAGLEKVKFRQIVSPGDQLHYEVKCLQKRAYSFKCFGQAKVDGKIVCEATILCVAQ